MLRKTILFFTLFSLVSIPPVSAPFSPPEIQPYGELMEVTITVDGDPYDWILVPPLVEDPVGDAIYDMEDIVFSFGANNDENLYFMMILNYPQRKVSSTQQGEHGEYLFYLDIIPGFGDPETGADYYINHTIGMILAATNGGEYTELYYWSGSEWILSSCLEIQGAFGFLEVPIIEVAVPWNCIGGKSCFNCYFEAHYSGSETDYSPDKNEGYVLLGCCPILPEPVGGELIPLGFFSIYDKYLSLGAIIVLIGCIFHDKNKFQ